MGPNRRSQARARSSLALRSGPRACSTALWAPRPMAQLTAPPSVLPAVATRMAGQNRSGLSLMRPNTAGSEPMGSRVADTNATTKTVLKPTSGRASQCMSGVNQVGMGGAL